MMSGNGVEETVHNLALEGDIQTIMQRLAVILLQFINFA